MRFSVFGGRGFIGRHLVRHLESRGIDVAVPERGAVIAEGAPLGHVVYAIGLTGDFRQRPYDTVEAHVETLARLIRRTNFDSWLYLSSTRVYGGIAAEEICDETRRLSIAPSADSLYDLSKLLGEAICLAHGKATVRVARLANVYGPGQSNVSFLGAVLDELKRLGKVTIREDRASSKDYVAIDDVVRLIADIAMSGRQRLYNVASGAPTTHGDIADRLAALGAGHVDFAAGAPLRRFPRIGIARVRGEFGFAPRLLVDDLPALLAP